MNRPHVYRQLLPSTTVLIALALCALPGGGVYAEDTEGAEPAGEETAGKAVYSEAEAHWKARKATKAALKVAQEKAARARKDVAKAPTDDDKKKNVAFYELCEAQQKLEEHDANLTTLPGSAKKAYLDKMVKDREGLLTPYRTSAGILIPYSKQAAGAKALVQHAEEGGEIAEYCAVVGLPAPQAPPEYVPDHKFESSPDTDFSAKRSGDLRLTAGYVALSPFKITGTADTGYKLADSDSESNFFLEALWTHRWAWSALGNEDRTWWGCREFGTDEQGKEVAEGMSWLLPDDWDMRFGVVLGSDSDLDATTIAGTGDMYAEVSAGWNLYRATFKRGSGTQPVSHSLNLEGSFGAVTDKNVQDIHDRQMLGLASVWGVPVALDDPRLAELLLRVGACRFEVPDIVDEGTTVVSKHSEPHFDNDTGAELGVEFRIPIYNENELTLGGKYYLGADGPNPWNMYVGYTIPLGKVKEYIPLPPAFVKKDENN